MEDEKGIKLAVELEDGVIKAGVHVDIVEVLKELAKQSTNSIDDMLVELVAKARDNADWKGLAKSFL